jgi:hypothetical protein
VIVFSRRKLKELFRVFFQLFAGNKAAMQPTTYVQEIREFVLHMFQTHGMESQDIKETILIREGCYCGRRFESQNGYAIWFCEENQLKIYNAHGKLLEVVHQLQARCTATATVHPISNAA